MELEVWRRVGEGWRVGAAENKQNWRAGEGLGRPRSEGWRASTGAGAIDRLAKWIGQESWFAHDQTAWARTPACHLEICAN